MEQNLIKNNTKLTPKQYIDYKIITFNYERLII